MVCCNQGTLKVVAGSSRRDVVGELVRGGCTSDGSPVYIRRAFLGTVARLVVVVVGVGNPSRIWIAVPTSP